ncbi:MAG: SpoIIE family protein phosphatase [Gammaproteobacteria bacterium]|nr:SpoIIE family protein phosphatase [Gammaproteobacteria bacterium]
MEDDRLNRAELRAILARMGHQVLLAGNGEEGVALFMQELPDMVLMDVLMPVMDGYEAVRQIKRHSGDVGQFIPVIFLTSLTDDAELARCVEYGGDDFLSKPYNYTLIKAKVDAFDRIHALYGMLARQKQELERHQGKLENEIKLARHVFNAVISKQPKNINCLRQWMYPVGHFSGDLLVYERSPGGQLYVMLGDFTGHGLAAALGAIPVSDIFFSMTKKGFCLADIAAEINRKLHYLLPTGHFCAACLISIDGVRKRVEVWNGSLPPVLVIDAEGRITRKILSTKLPLGVVGGADFDRHPEVIPLSDVHSLLLYSDGLIEAQNSSGQQFNMTGLDHAVHAAGSAAAVFDAVKDGITKFMDGHEAHDDISLLELQCEGLSGELMDGVTEGPSGTLATAWSLELRLGVGTLRKIDPLPVLMNWLVQTKLSEGQRIHVYTVLSELVNNAVEHGLLELDSSKKATFDGFESYYTKRNELLEKLAQGHVSIRLEQSPVVGGRLIKMRVEDSGQGFDVDKVYSMLDDNKEKFGRGIALARSMCSTLVYKGNGNTVEAEYRG